MLNNIFLGYCEAQIRLLEQRERDTRRSNDNENSAHVADNAPGDPGKQEGKQNE
jgi:hypothetical protein